MPGSLLYDFGDSIRFGCNPAGEDEKDISKVNFNIEYFKAYVEGYLSQVGKIMTEEEINNLAFAGILMTFECGIRFLDDYLDGDNYTGYLSDGYYLNQPYGLNIRNIGYKVGLTTDFKKIIDTMLKRGEIKKGVH